MIATIGWIGSGCFAFSTVPQAWKAYREKHASGVSWGLLVLSIGGEICCTIYAVPKNLWPFVANYTINLVMLLIIVYYKIKGQNLNGTT